MCVDVFAGVSVSLVAATHPLVAGVTQSGHYRCSAGLGRLMFVSVCVCAHACVCVCVCVCV